MAELKERMQVMLSQSWELGRVLDEGGFGKVYVASSSACKDAVAKFVPKLPGAGRELLFTELTGTPHVVPVIDQGEWEDYYVLVMPRADHSLRQHIVATDGRLPLRDGLHALIDVAEALVALEGRIVHRDLKPENILFLNGQWCLTDFGISRYAEATTALDTRKYAMSPPYAAPEQWRSERAASSTDVYALGVIGYELLTGTRPFPGPDLNNYREQHLTASPPPVPSVPTALQSLLMECLHKAPGARPTPQNLLQRLQNSIVTPSPGLGALQAANQFAVERIAEEGRQASAALTEAERRRELSGAAQLSLVRISDELRDRVLAGAPAAEVQGTAYWTSKLNNALLGVGSIEQVSPEAYEAPSQPGFEIIVHSSIGIRIPRDRFDYEGRSHSLWYCDAEQRGSFRWCELAFMSNPLITGGRTYLNPYRLEPGRDAYEALAPVIGKTQIAWSLSPIDQGAEEEFIERWLTWFARAAMGKLQMPTTMPER